MATRWRWPPERVFGSRLSTSVRSSISAARSTRALISSAGIFVIFSAKAMFSATLMCGYSAKVWNTIATLRSRVCSVVTSRPPMRTSPESHGSRPASMRNVVDLPDPDGPTMATNSPEATDMLSRSTAGLGCLG